MIERLQHAINASEDRPKLKSLLLKIAALKEENQELMLGFIDIIIEQKKEKKNEY